MARTKGPEQSIHFSLRISRATSPQLYERLTSGLLDQESQAAVTRQLAEEALLLRNHPILKALQLVDSSRLFEKNIHYPKNPLMHIPGEDAKLALTEKPINASFQTEKPEPPADPGRAESGSWGDGGSLLAGLLVNKNK